MTLFRVTSGVTQAIIRADSTAEAIQRFRTAHNLTAQSCRAVVVA